VEGEPVPAVAGSTSSDGDEVAADGGGAGPGVAAAGQRAGGPEQVVGDGSGGQPGGVGGELPGRQVGQRPVAEVGEELLDHGVAAVLLLGLDQLYLQPQLTCP
jgi:hypothetical protein